MQAGDLLDVCARAAGAGMWGWLLVFCWVFFLVKFSGPAPCGILVP